MLSSRTTETVEGFDELIIAVSSLRADVQKIVSENPTDGTA